MKSEIAAYKSLRSDREKRLALLARDIRLILIALIAFSVAKNSSLLAYWWDLVGRWP